MNLKCKRPKNDKHLVIQMNRDLSKQTSRGSSEQVNRAISDAMNKGRSSSDQMNRERGVSEQRRAVLISVCLDGVCVWATNPLIIAERERSASTVTAVVLRCYWTIMLLLNWLHSLEPTNTEGMWITLRACETTAVVSYTISIYSLGRSY